MNATLRCRFKKKNNWPKINKKFMVIEKCVGRNKQLSHNRDIFSMSWVYYPYHFGVGLKQDSIFINHYQFTCLFLSYNHRNNIKNIYYPSKIYPSPLSISPSHNLDYLISLNFIYTIKTVFSTPYAYLSSDNYYQRSFTTAILATKNPTGFTQNAIHY